MFQAALCLALRIKINGSSGDKRQETGDLGNIFGGLFNFHYYYLCCSSSSSGGSSNGGNSSSSNSNSSSRSSTKEEVKGGNSMIYKLPRKSEREH